MKKIDSDEFKILTLEMLKQFDKICAENDLCYVIDYGTLLGAVRHSGFIPWDDDVDVVMPRKDYDRLISLFDNDDDLFGNNYKLSTMENKYSTQKPYLNLIDTRTITISQQRKEKYYYPIWIDVFPMDYSYPNSKESMNAHKKCFSLLHKIQLAHSAGWRINAEMHGWYLERRYLPFVKKYKKEIEKVARKANEMAIRSSEYTNYYSAYKNRDTAPKEYFEKIVEIEFEKIWVKSSACFEERLTRLYGDYMSLPPEGKRIPHVTDAYWID